MEQNKKHPLVHRPSAEIATRGRRTSRVMATVTRDILARAQALSAARFPIGEYLLREQDYRQILDWADHLSMEPEAVIQHLARSRKILSA